MARFLDIKNTYTVQIGLFTSFHPFVYIHGISISMRLTLLLILYILIEYLLAAIQDIFPPSVNKIKSQYLINTAIIPWNINSPSCVFGACDILYLTAKSLFVLVLYLVSLPKRFDAEVQCCHLALTRHWG